MSESVPLRTVCAALTTSILGERALQQREQREVVLRRNTLRVALVQPCEHVVHNAVILSHLRINSLLGHEWEQVDTGVVDDRRPRDPEDSGDDHPGDEQEQRDAQYFKAGLGACVVPSVSVPPAPLE